ncbi:acyl-ACP--UDP-N-acetylglucosamine O-acyltransferase [Pseudoxanthomonas taiwanensis]|jgi:acyl-[acyl-carrier-protein]--UDP-N-acetylglucosamine O-acyltransferase|uniref:Acyl-[acyl-carrier-protein]--UDP-N-acetylglucosamine O-acyltransferase n=1 Tax=Pseudoxanthomonas taiwanensis TaxID=176598 RepID=A0A921NU00_9GAMM|nr:acyl-ACP--UDP-N-acetylglucosamine O-acyltransferase [Pseudoxanthomonas taiwanensis]KAF1686796.1 acyl-[acyl-carrier-protein]--UDP-N-acetylglucosamine O-acyltransferase [Pseudoxanthomonas taiwanensis]MBO2466351.1 acyl-[acyl-carrier-protein]--UDP-N-acetylglucosamine O-acyltransferase [Xanthomonadaceae bacterium]
MNDSSTRIHPTAVVDPGARLGQGVTVGAFTYIGPEVEIGDGCQIGPHCSFTGPTRIGRDNRFVGHAAIGGDPQDKKFGGERTELVIGDRNLFREFVTLNRGTGNGGGVTRIGNDNWMLAYTHVAHDCIVGNNCVFSNNTTLAGHVVVDDWVIMSGFSGAHQFCRIGAHAFIGMGALVNGDVPPYTMVGGNSLGRPRGINTEGLKRRGFSPERIAAIKRAYRTLYVAGLPLAEAREKLAEQAQSSEDVRLLVEFLGGGERPLLR